MEFRRVLFRSFSFHPTVNRIPCPLPRLLRAVTGPCCFRPNRRPIGPRSEERRVGKECRSRCDGVQTCALPIFLVSPDGESHPLPASSIAPRSYRALLLPPEPPAYRASPSFSIGFGVGHYWGGPHFGTGFGYHDYWYGGPREYYQANSPDYWGWETGPVRMRLSFEQGSTNTFEHDFVIERRKVE